MNVDGMLSCVDCDRAGCLEIGKKEKLTKSSVQEFDSAIKTSASFLESKRCLKRREG